MRKEVILISGARGLVANKLLNILSDIYEVRFLTRKKISTNEFEWNLEKQWVDINAFENVNHIIHLAGAGIADKYWTKKRKLEIRNSRIATAQLILDTLIKNEIKITSFISASGVGYYGMYTSDKIFTENDKAGNDFLSSVCYEWEQVANMFAEKKIAKRVLILRFGVILSKNGGVLKRMTPPVKYNIGAYLGKGNQYMPWIHITDLCSAIGFVIQKQSVEGIFNIVAPQHITNKEFVTVLAHTMKKPLFLPPVPGWLLRIFFGEASLMLLNGSRASSEKIQEAGFEFNFSDLESALSNL